MKLRDQTSILTKKIGPLIGQLTVSDLRFARRFLDQILIGKAEFRHSEVKDQD